MTLQEKLAGLNLAGAFGKYFKDIGKLHKGQDISNPQTWRLLHEHITGQRLPKGNHPTRLFAKALQKHLKSPSITTDSIPRSYIEDTKLSEKDLKNMGFMESRIAVPEQGQSQLITYRHPMNNVHLHKHDGRWMFHVDDHPSLQMLKERMLMEGKNPYTVSNYSKAILASAPHVLLEGVPGYIRYAKNWMLDNPTFNDRAIANKKLREALFRGERKKLQDFLPERNMATVAKRTGMVGIPTVGLGAAALAGGSEPVEKSTWEEIKAAFGG